jgi:hypothetical protein
MVNTHQHISTGEILTAIAEDRVEKLSSSKDDCLECLKNLEKAKLVVQSLTANYFLPTDNLYNSLSDDVKTEDEFKNSFPEIFEKERVSPKIKDKRKTGFFKSLLKPQILVPVMAACILAIATAYNFFYYLLLPEYQFINISHPVTVERKGLWFYHFPITTNKILYNYETVENQFDNLHAKLDKSIEFESLENSKFIILDHIDEKALEFFKGEFYLRFNKLKPFGSDKTLFLQNSISVHLPMNSRLIITGTEVYFNTSVDKFKLLLVKGKSRLFIGNKKSISLKSGKLYSYDSNNKLTKKKISKKRKKSILKKFDLGMEYLNRDKTKGRRFKTLADIRKVYKKIDKIILFNGQIIKGAIIKKGKTLKVITVDGVKKIKKKDVQNISLLP